MLLDPGLFYVLKFLAVLGYSISAGHESAILYLENP